MEKLPDQNVANPQPPNNPTPHQGTLDTAALYSVWNKQFRTPLELFQTTTEFTDKKIVADTHLIVNDPAKINLIAYDDGLGEKQTDLKKYFQPGEIGISIKHHSPHPEEGLSEHIKLQCSHIQVVVRTKDGVITVNNPQDYQQGLFGDPSYPMIFTKPVFPDSLTPAQVQAYIQNIRTWLVIANTFTVFPGNYNGSDPLTCLDKTKILKMGKSLVGAIQKNPHDLEWLQNPEQHAYCAELAYLALNLGLYFPLNKQHLGSAFEFVKKELESKKFLDSNNNKHIKNIDIAMADDSLAPIDNLISLSGSGQFWNGLAVTPFSIADMIEQFIQRTIPRHDLGEAEGSKYQPLVFEKIKPMLKEFLEIENTEAEPVFDQAIIKVSKIVSTRYPSYTDFRNALMPVFKELEEISLKYGHAYVPPHCFLIRATDSISHQKQNGVLGWKYVGHGLHSSLLK